MMMMTQWFGGGGWAIYNTLVGAAEGPRPTSGGRLSFIATHGMEIHGHGHMGIIQKRKQLLMKREFINAEKGFPGPSSVPQSPSYILEKCHLNKKVLSYINVSHHHHFVESAYKAVSPPQCLIWGMWRV